MSRPEPRRDFHVVDAVPVPRRSRLRTGFHRIGLVLAAPIVVFAGAGFLFSVFGNPAQPKELAILSFIVLLGAPFVYAGCRLLAWIVAGFLGN